MVELTGRELDVATALAMGWRCLAKTPSATSKWTDGKALQHPGPVSRRALPRFHDNPAAIPEMLERLRSHHGVLSVNFVVKVECQLYRWGRVVCWAVGGTLNEALARLVVAAGRTTKEAVDG